MSDTALPDPEPSTPKNPRRAGNFEKGRYVRLDGSPLEHGFVRRTFAPKGLSIYFLVATGCTLPHAPMDDIGDFIPAVVLTVSGVLNRRYLNFFSNIAWTTDFHNYVIDTKPNAKTEHHPPEMYDARAIFVIGINGIALAKNLSGVIDDVIDMNLSDAFHKVTTLDVPFLLPAFHQAFQHGYSYNKVRTGEWKIIRNANMDPYDDMRGPPLASLGKILNGLRPAPAPVIKPT